jgi:hypothetical protein
VRKALVQASLKAKVKCKAPKRLKCKVKSKVAKGWKAFPKANVKIYTTFMIGNLR